MSLPSERHGALLNKDGTTHFAIWAPDATSVSIQLGNEETTYELYSDPDGWYKSTMDCPAGTSYRYLINREFYVPDPASRAQLGDIHGASRVVDQGYPWKSVTWHGRPWHEAIIYEIHVGLAGGFSAVEASLPSLVELGITAIELMPINEFPGNRNWGYDGVLLFAPEASYGTPDELKSLVDTAHELGLMVILDVVYNHFGPDGNYLGKYAKGFFRNDIQTPWGSAIDFRQQQVRNFFCENALMWLLDYHFDGLRLDAVHAISDKGFLVELAKRVHNAVLPGHHVHLILENEDNLASLLEKGFDAQWNDDGHNVLHHLLTGEDEGYYVDFADSPTAKLARCLSEGFIYQGDLTPRGHHRGEVSGHLPPTSFILFLQNHDQIGNRAFGERLTQLADPDALKAVTALLLLSPMIPLMFMGDEWGSKQPFLFFTDHHDELAKAVCEGRRKEFEGFAHFRNPDVRAEIPDPNDITTFISSKFDPDKHSDVEHAEWYRLYQQLLSLRKTEIIPRLPEARTAGVIILGEAAIAAAWRLGDGVVLRIYLNLSNEAVSANPSWANGRLLFSHNLPKADYEQDQLPPHSVLVAIDEQATITEPNEELKADEEQAAVYLAALA